MNRELAKWVSFQQRAQSDFAAFCESGCVRDEAGRPLLLAAHHRAWIEHLKYAWQRNLNPLIFAPWGHGKSTIVIVALAAFELARNPNIRIKVVSNDDASATARVGAIRRIVESPEFCDIFPAVRQGSRWTNHEMILDRASGAIDASLAARGVFTTGIGSRCDLLLVDDAVDFRNSADPLQRRKVLETLDLVWFSRLAPQGRIAAIGTPWFADDAWSHLMARQGWCSLIQRISDDCHRIEQDLVGAVDNAYPWPSAGSQAQAVNR